MWSVRHCLQGGKKEGRTRAALDPNPGVSSGSTPTTNGGRIRAFVCLPLTQALQGVLVSHSLAKESGVMEEPKVIQIQ